MITKDLNIFLYVEKFTRVHPVFIIAGAWNSRYDFSIWFDNSGTMYNIKEIEALKKFMLSRKHTLAVAESVTSGHLQAALSLADQASLFFQGGITTYNLGQKARHLNVNPIHAMECNSVSEKVAEEMAMNVSRLFSSDWSIGITGYAAPLPEIGIKDLYAFYSISFHNKIIKTQKLTCPNSGLLEVQVYFTKAVIRQMNACLKRSGK